MPSKDKTLIGVPDGKASSSRSKLSKSLGDLGREFVEVCDNFKDPRRKGMVRVIKESLLPQTEIPIEKITSPFFSHNQQKSNYDYPVNYEVDKSLEEQLAGWKEKIAHLNIEKSFQYIATLPELDPRMERWLVVPKMQSVLENPSANFYQVYHPATKYMIDLLVKVLKVRSKKLVNNLPDIKTTTFILHDERTVQAYLRAQQQYSEGDFIFLQFQAGKRWRDESSQTAQDNYDKDEFGGDLYQSLNLTIDSLNRFDFDNSHLYIDIPANRVLSGDAFSKSPVLYTWIGDLWLYCDSADDAHSYYGAVSGLVRS